MGGLLRLTPPFRFASISWRESRCHTMQILSSTKRITPFLRPSFDQSICHTHPALLRLSVSEKNSAQTCEGCHHA